MSRTLFLVLLVIFLVLLNLGILALGLYWLITGITGGVVWKIVIGGFITACYVFGGGSRVSS